MVLILNDELIIIIKLMYLKLILYFFAENEILRVLMENLILQFDGKHTIWRNG